MQIFVNARPHEVQGTRLDQVLTETGFDRPTIATALNGDFIPLEERAETELKDGDRVEVLAPMQGG